MKSIHQFLFETHFCFVRHTFLTRFLSTLVVPLKSIVSVKIWKCDGFSRLMFTIPIFVRLHFFNNDFSKCLFHFQATSFYYQIIQWTSSTSSADLEYYFVIRASFNWFCSWIKIANIAITFFVYILWNANH